MQRLEFTFRKTNQQQVDVHIGKNIVDVMPDLLRKVSSDAFFIVCDSIVMDLYADLIQRQVERIAESQILVHEPGEINKNLYTVARMADEFTDLGGNQESCICSLGGGVTGNMAGLLSALLFRGLNLVHVPTTLLAQLDSAPDVKQSVNATRTKNSIGTYKSPHMVIIDPQFLVTLTDRQIRSGLAEAAKHGIAQDLTFATSLASCDYRDVDALEEIIIKTISLKKSHWENTPAMWNSAKKVERLTHLGHTTGKVLEMIIPGHLTHGEAIAHGMVIEADISRRLGFLDSDSLDWMHNLLSRMNLLPRLTATYQPGRIISDLYGTSSSPLFALLQGPGNPDTISTTVDKAVALKSISWHLASLP